MKIATSFLAALLFAGTLGALNNAIAEDGVLSEDQLTGTTYCHKKFPAIAQHTLGNDQPELSSKGDVIDFYGPCDTTLWGKIKSRTRNLKTSIVGRGNTRVSNSRSNGKRGGRGPSSTRAINVLISSSYSGAQPPDDDTHVVSAQRQDREDNSDYSH